MTKMLFINTLRIRFPGKTLATALGCFVLGCSAKAVPVTVQEIGVGPNEVIEMTSSTLGNNMVYAGMLNLLVNGTPTDGFCIDPFHWSISGPQAYNSEPLGDGPKSPGGAMGPSTALKIAQLWQQYYAHNMNNQEAAGLQIAIWELVGGSNFHLDSTEDYGAGTMLNWLDNNQDAAAANLMAVTGPGQDYVVQNCPETSATIALLSAGLAGLTIFRLKYSRV